MNRTGIVLMAQSMNNKEQGEINTVRKIIEQLELKGIVLSMDALHCQKNALHYVKDFTLKEDESKIRSGNAPAILPLVKNLIINIAHINGENRRRKYMHKCAGNIVLIASLIE